MAKPLLPDDLWEIIEPLPSKWPPSPRGGQPRVGDRNVLTGSSSFSRPASPERICRAR